MLFNRNHINFYSMKIYEMQVSQFDVYVREPEDVTWHILNHTKIYRVYHSKEKYFYIFGGEIEIRRRRCWPTSGKK